MYDSLPHSSKAFVVGAGRPAAKLTLGPGLDAATWDAIFGHGTHDAVAARVRTSPAEAFTRQGWFRKCADLMGKGVASLPWAIYDAEAESADEAEPLWTETDPNPPDALAPLAGLSRSLYLAGTSLALTGRFYFGRGMVEQGQRVPGSRLQRFSGLRYWSPYTVKPEWRSGQLVFRRTVNGQERDVDPDAVVWGWQPDPFVEMGPGSSDGQAAAHNAAVLDALARFLGDHLDGGLVKMTVLSTTGDVRIPPEDASKLRAAWHRFLRGMGIRNEGPPVLNGITPHTIGEGLKELANEVLTKEQRQAICTAFGIPWSVLSSESANYATAQVEERGFYLRSVIPQAQVIEAALNDRLLKEYGLQLRFESGRHEVMQQFELEKAEKLALLVDRVFTREEARMQMNLPAEPKHGAFPARPVEVGRDGRPDGPDAARSLKDAAPEPLEDRIARIVGEGR